MSKHVALVEGDKVVNTAVFDDDFSETEWDGYQAFVTDERVNVGWLFDGTNFAPPPAHSLYSNPNRIAANEKALVVYVNTTETSPAEVTFEVNGATQTVALTDGEAILEVTPSGVGPVEVSVNQDILPITLQVEEV